MRAQRAPESKVGASGRVTIPKTVREHLKLRLGSKIKFFFHPDGHWVILPVLPVSSLRGMVRSRREKPVSIEEMDKAIAAAVSRKFNPAGRSRGR